MPPNIKIKFYNHAVAKYIARFKRDPKATHEPTANEIAQAWAELNELARTAQCLGVDPQTNYVTWQLSNGGKMVTVLEHPLSTTYCCLTVLPA